MATDPWTSFLDWLTTVLVPAWGELIGMHDVGCADSPVEAMDWGGLKALY